MAGNAHRRRNKRRPTLKHVAESCFMCIVRPSGQLGYWKKKLYRNSNGHRHNPAANKKQKK